VVGELVNRYLFDASSDPYRVVRLCADDSAARIHAGHLARLTATPITVWRILDHPDTGGTVYIGDADAPRPQPDPWEAP
jgi:hypothetical protein